MGKYARKAKVSLDVAVMDVSRSCLGVRTRAKTLALQRLESGEASAPRPEKPDVCYLELRSRRLEKPMQRQNSRNVRHGCGCAGKAETGGREPCLRSGSNEEEGLGTEASYGENDLNSDTCEGGTRESTPCNLIMAADAITTPISATKQTCSSAANRRIRNALINAPSACELEEFFIQEERSLQHHFIEKYNFDIINDVPLPGRYEWVAVRP